MQHYPSGEITSSKPGLIHPIQYTDYFSSPSFHIYNIHYQYGIYTYTHTHQRSMEALSTTMLKRFRSLKVLLSLPGGSSAPPTFSEGSLRSLLLEKLSFPALLSTSPPSIEHGRKLLTLSNTFQVGICAASICLFEGLSSWKAQLSRLL